MPAPSARVVLALVVSFVVAAAGFFLPLPAAVTAVAVGVFAAQCAAWWWLAAQGGPHIVYLLRDRAGWVRYVGTVKERKNGPATLRERLEEHEDSIDQYPWKSAIYWPNCTVARRCLTRRGTTWSEKRRIHSLAFAGRLRMCSEIKNVQHNTVKRTAIVGLLWYRMESAIWPSARWHKPLVAQVDGDVADPEPEPVERRPAHVPDDDEFGFFRAVAESVRPSAGPEPADDGGADDLAYTDEQIAAMFSAWESELSGDTSGPADDGVPGVSRWDVSQRPGAGEDPYGASDVLGHGTRDTGHAGTSESAAVDGDADGDGPETAENGDRSARHGGDARSAHPAGSGGSTGRQPEGGTSGRQCCEEGCTEAAWKGPRCSEHKRQWEAERKRKQRGKDKDGDQ